jgi:hypothetical protein
MLTGVPVGRVVVRLDLRNRERSVAAWKAKQRPADKVAAGDRVLV